MTDSSVGERGGDLQIEAVSGRRGFRLFAILPRRLYAGMPGFEPPLDAERRRFLHPAYAPLFERGEVQYWLAWRAGVPVGRISAQVDPITLQAWDEPIGMFGCLDAIDDCRVVSALINAASLWLKARGMKRIRGPFTLSINGETGLLVEGQTSPPMLMSPWHPEYLARHVEAELPPAKDLFSYVLNPSSLNDKLSGRAADALSGEISVRGIERSKLLQEAETLRDIFNDAWSGNWGFVPLTETEITRLAKLMSPLITNDSVVFVQRGKEAVAFALILPNTYDLARGFGGRLLPLNWIRFAWRLWRRKYRSARILLLGVRPDFRSSAVGVMAPMLMVNEVMRRNRHYNIESLELGWALEDNVRIRRIAEAYGGVVIKRYRIYERAIGE